MITEEIIKTIHNQNQVGGCHDAATEVLTKDGWKLFSNLDANDHIASVNPVDSNLIYEKPASIVSFNYKGDMYHCDHRSIDFSISPNHKMLVKKWNEAKRTLNQEYQFIQIKDLGWYVGLMPIINYNGDPNIDKNHVVIKGVSHKLKIQRNDMKIDMKAWLEFLGIYTAEGTMLKSYIKPNGKEYGANKIQIAASKDREKQFVRKVLTNLGLNYLELKDRFTFSNKRIFHAMKSLGLFGVKAPYKFVPEFIFRLDSENMRHFLHGHFMGDGCGKEGDEYRQHYTSSVRLANDLQLLIFLSGGWGIFSIRPPRTNMMKDGRVVRGIFPEHMITHRKINLLSIDKKRQISTEPYEGMVYGVEMPTYHTLITRRNRKILISGGR